MIRNQPAYSIRASDHESHAKAGCMAAINPVSQNSRKYLARRGRPCMDHSPSGRARPSQHWAALGACAARACRYKHMRSRTDCGRSRFMTRSDGYRRGARRICGRRRWLRTSPLAAGERYRYARNTRSSALTSSAASAIIFWHSSTDRFRRTSAPPDARLRLS